MAWRNGLVAINTGCSAKCPGFSSWHPCVSSQQSITEVPWDPMPSSDVQTDIQTKQLYKIINILCKLALTFLLENMVHSKTEDQMSSTSLDFIFSMLLAASLCPQLLPFTIPFAIATNCLLPLIMTIFISAGVLHSLCNFLLLFYIVP